ncbi:PAS domain-containing protein, partial [Beijerinckia sp. L45]|uniref:PAS domain-containing protein n=1 Tax=Beijerinckia sp. L45 TaxID=1641855 RepID=UPI00131E1530
MVRDDDASDSRYRMLADSLPQMVWVMQSETGLCSYANGQFDAFYGDIGPDRDARVSRNHPDDAPQMEAAWRAALESGTVFAAEGRLLRRDGVYRWHKLIMAPVVRGGRGGEWLGTALDIDEIVTARRR